MLAWKEGQNDELSCCVFKTICFSRGGGMFLLQKNIAHTQNNIYTFGPNSYGVFGPNTDIREFKNSDKLHIEQYNF